MKTKVSKSEQIRKLHDQGKTVKQIKAKLGCSHALIGVVLSNYRKKLKKSKIVKAVKEMKQVMDKLEKKPTLKMRSWVEANEPKVTRKDLLNEIKPGLDALFGNKVEKKPTKLFVQPQHEYAAMKILADNDLVNHPPHYKAGGVETIDFIEAKDLNYRLGNVVKYVSRAGKKSSDPVQDLEKAAWYLQREITARKGA